MIYVVIGAREEYFRERGIRAGEEVSACNLD